MVRGGLKVVCVLGLHVPNVLKSGSLNSWNPQGLSRPVLGFHYLYISYSVVCLAEICRAQFNTGLKGEFLTASYGSLLWLGMIFPRQENWQFWCMCQAVYRDSPLTMQSNDSNKPYISSMGLESILMFCHPLVTTT